MTPLAGYICIFSRCNMRDILSIEIPEIKTPTITMVRREVDFSRLKQLILEFATSIDFDLSYQNFLLELATITDVYSPPKGIAYILSMDNNTIGCVGIQILNPGVSVVKRLFIRSDFKAPHFGKQLLKVAIDWASQKGMRKLLMDSSDIMHCVSKLCKDEGFFEVANFSDDNVSNQKCYEMRLTPKSVLNLQAAS